MNSYSFSEEAIQDLQEICNYLRDNNPNSASNLFDAIRQKCKVVAQFPLMGKSYEVLAPRLRGFVVHDYLVFYYVQESGIAVVRIVSGYRDLRSLFEDES